jgi:hypothetical protein
MLGFHSKRILLVFSEGKLSPKCVPEKNGGTVAQILGNAKHHLAEAKARALDMAGVQAQAQAIGAFSTNAWVG